LRLAGNSQETKKLKAEYNNGDRPDLSLCDPNVVGDILKSYLRELPIGLLIMTKGLKDGAGVFVFMFVFSSFIHLSLFVLLWEIF
jgi:hypothetical protein